MGTIEKLLKQIIPPITRSDGKDREWFSNNEIISKLNDSELKSVEQHLVEMLKTSDDLLIPQTLIKLKSLKCIPIMLDRLESLKNPFSRIVWASFVNEIKNGDEEMEQIAFEEFERLEFIYEIQSVIFYDLIKFKSLRINNLISKYANHKYFLVAHHSKKVLKQI